MRFLGWMLSVISLATVCFCPPAAKANPKQRQPSADAPSVIEEQKQLYPSLRKVASFQKGNVAEKEESTAFYKDAKRGWYYFEEIPDEEKKPDKNEEEIKEILAFDWSTFQNLTAEETNKVMKELQDFAITHQDKKHTQLYMTAQYVVKEKAKGFMNSWADVLREHPVLDDSVRRPPSTFVSNQLAGVESKTQFETLKMMAQDPNVGLILFHSFDCYYCTQQKPIVDDFIKSIGWKTYQYVDITGRQDLVEKFHIETIPEIWLAVKDKDMVRVTAGLRTLDVIQENLVKAYTSVVGPIIHTPYKMTTTIDKLKQEKK